MKTVGIIVRIEYLDSAWKYFCNESYLQACRKHHVQPILLCCGDDINTILSMCDALLIPGGYDIASHYYHQEQNKHATLYEKAMDHLDFTLLDAFVKAKKPILGICRGIQLINVYFNGTLHQHIDTTTHEQQPHAHRIEPYSSTIFSQLLKENSIVNSYHHQCIDILGEHLQVGAYSHDKRIEAIQHDTLPIMAVQWHPEKIEDDQIFPYFFDTLCRTFTF